jgi:hypothetical protein
MNTRRYPRTLAEAFKGADYASAVTVYGRPGLRKKEWAALIAALAGILALWV